MTASELSSINRANAAHSTGPKTVEGKERASMNAIKHGLTGQRLILQPSEYEAFARLTRSLRAELRPKTTLEIELVQKIIDCHLRLNRIAAIDNNLLNIGLVENLAVPADDEPFDLELERAAAQARSWVAQQMTFDKLGRYEARISRQLLAYTKEFERLQSNRIAKERASAEPRRTAAPARTYAETASFGTTPSMPDRDRPRTAPPHLEPVAA